MKLIKETPLVKVWKAVEGKFINGEGTEAGKYLVVDVYHGVTLLKTDSLVEALYADVKLTEVEIMGDALVSHIMEFSHKNTDFNRKLVIEGEIKKWNSLARSFGREEYVITETFHRRQELANKFAEIYESL